MTSNSRGNRWLERIACPECGFTTKRSNMPSHLKTQRHGWRHERALDYARTAVAIEAPLEVAEAPLPAVVTEVPARRGRPPRQPVDFSAIDPAEIALGVIESQAPGGTIPVVLLAEIVAYVEHTRAVVGRLRALQS